MRYLNAGFLNAFDARAFRGIRPFPFTNPEGALTNTGYRRLVETMPDPELFRTAFGKSRAFGQTSHDRLVLDYHPDLPIADAWHEFVRELQGDAYRGLLRRALGRDFFRLLLHWHYTPTGCSVSPHCDSPRKLGSHIFYFNTPDDWDEGWGGETLILDDPTHKKTNSAPDFADFERVIPAKTMHNRSLLFVRRAGSWHGVRALTCPEGAYRKVFIVVAEDPIIGAAHRMVKAVKSLAG